MNRDYKALLKRFPITYGMIIICILVYIYTTIRYGFSMSAYDAYESGAFMPYCVINLHQYYRLITANFLHFGLIHLACNTISLRNIGPFVESQFKRYEYLIIVITSMVFTNSIETIQYIATGKDGYTVSAGISGVVFGLLGAIIVLGLVYKGYYQRVMRSLMPSICLMLFISISVPSISLFGHLGGLLGGMAATFYVIKMRSTNQNYN